MTVKIAYETDSGRIVRKYSIGKKYPDWWNDVSKGIETAEIELSDGERENLLQNEKESYTNLSDDEVVSAWLTYDGSDVSVDSEINNI